MWSATWLVGSAAAERALGELDQGRFDASAKHLGILLPESSLDTRLVVVGFCCPACSTTRASACTRADQYATASLCLLSHGMASEQRLFGNLGIGSQERLR